jgi:hypothetical protein
MSTARPVYPQLWKYFGVAANRRDGPAKKLASVESSVELFPLSILDNRVLRHRGPGADQLLFER